MLSSDYRKMQKNSHSEMFAWNSSFFSQEIESLLHLRVRNPHSSNHLPIWRPFITKVLFQCQSYVLLELFNYWVFPKALVSIKKWRSFFMFFEIHIFLFPIVLVYTILESRKVYGSFLVKNCSFLWSLTSGENFNRGEHCKKRQASR